MICRRSFVSGRVQGVYYRGTCVRKAEALGLRGYARNLADGRVEVLACGEPAAIEAFVSWLWLIGLRTTADQEVRERSMVTDLIRSSNAATCKATGPAAPSATK